MSRDSVLWRSLLLHRLHETSPIGLMLCPVTILLTMLPLLLLGHGDADDRLS